VAFMRALSAAIVGREVAGRTLGSVVLGAVVIAVSEVPRLRIDGTCTTPARDALPCVEPALPRSTKLVVLVVVATILPPASARITMACVLHAS
jgi:hypothetical protein